MDFVIRNLRLKELVAVVRENKRFYEDFVAFLKGEGYTSVLDFIQEQSDERAAETITKYGSTRIRGVNCDTRANLWYNRRENPTQGGPIWKRCCC